VEIYKFHGKGKIPRLDSKFSGLWKTVGPNHQRRDAALLDSNGDIEAVVNLPYSASPPSRQAGIMWAGVSLFDVGIINC